MYKKVATLLFSLSILIAPFMGNCQFLKQLVTAKFTPGGEVAWERYAGDNLGRTTVRGICADVNSNVYITGNSSNGIWFGDTWFGCSIFVAKYSPEGALLWAKPITGSTMKISGIAVDSEENCYVVGNFNSLLISDTISISIENYLNPLFIIKYNKKGETVWVNHFLNKNTSYEDRFKIEAAGITVNEKYKHIYITGLVDEVDHDAGGTHDSKLFVAKCSMEGKGVLKYKEIAQTNAYPKSHYLNYGYGIKNDSSSVYVCGSMKNSSGKSDFYIAKLDTSLDIIWEQQPAQSVASIAYDLTLGEENNIYVTGFFEDSLQISGQSLKTFGGQDILILNYSDEGDFIWAKNAGNPEWWSSDNSWSISYDKYISCLYLSGYVEENSSFPPGIQIDHKGPFLARMSTDGNFEKVNVFESDYEYDYDFGGGKVACAPDGSYYFTINIEDMKDTIILGSPVIKQQVKNINISLYPNPAKKEVTISIGSKLLMAGKDIQYWDLEVYNPAQVLVYKKVGLKSPETGINTEGWVEGMFLVRIKIGETILNRKLVIAK